MLEYIVFFQKFNIVNKPPSCPENFQLCNEEVDDANDRYNEVTMSQGMNMIFIMNRCTLIKLCIFVCIKLCKIYVL